MKRGGALASKGDFNLESAAAQAPEFTNHGCTRINPDNDGEPASPQGRVVRCSHRFEIRVHSGLSVVHLRFLGSNAFSRRLGANLPHVFATSPLV